MRPLVSHSQHFCLLLLFTFLPLCSALAPSDHAASPCDVLAHASVAPSRNCPGPSPCSQACSAAGFVCRLIKHAEQQRLNAESVGWLAAAVAAVGNFCQGIERLLIAQKLGAQLAAVCRWRQG
ncbi:hypothetical protein ABPG75_002700 [Micractinium tetrahymenae]